MTSMQTLSTTRPLTVTGLPLPPCAQAVPVALTTRATTATTIRHHAFIGSSSSRGSRPQLDGDTAEHVETSVLERIALRV